MMEPLRFIEHTRRALVFVVLGAALSWIAVRFGWPLCGPYLLQPCPLATPLGCLLALLVGVLWGMKKCIEIEIAERRRARNDDFERRYQARGGP
jgi:hypothetical protein